MVMHSYPGVYVEEDAWPMRAITGVPTSTAGFIGIVADDASARLGPARLLERKGAHEPRALPPVREPQSVTSWEQFKDMFGDIQEGNFVLAHGVHGFFKNGGRRCWVARVAESANVDEINKELIDALDAFKAINEIALVAIPGATADVVQNAILDHCEIQSRFAILDGRRTKALSKQAVRGQTRDSCCGAIYFPWIELFDPVSAGTVYAPPSAHIAGVYARVDAERGVHKAPANEVIHGAAGVEVEISDTEQGPLNLASINVIRLINGKPTLRGARTLAGKEGAEWRYVNVRRLINFLQRSIDEGTKWVVFEPNDEPLWAQIRSNVSGLMQDLFRQCAFQGSSPREAYFVRCGKETTTQDDINQGIVNIVVGFAPLKLGEFVVFKIQQSTEKVQT